MTIGVHFSGVPAPPLPTSHRLTPIAAPRWLGGSSKSSPEIPVKPSLSLRAHGRSGELSVERSLDSAGVDQAANNLRSLVWCISKATPTRKGGAKGRRSAASRHAAVTAAGWRVAAPLASS
jgi:hypothetical protein